MTSTAADPAVWKPKARPTIRLARLSKRDEIEHGLDALAKATAAKDQERLTVCRVERAVYILSRLCGSDRSAVRATLILALERDDIDDHLLIDYLQDSRQLHHSAVPLFLDLRDHRNRVCSCFCDPYAPPMPTAIDDLYDRVRTLRKDVQELLAFRDQMTSTAQTTPAGTDR